MSAADRIQNAQAQSQPKDDAPSAAGNFVDAPAGASGAESKELRSRFVRMREHFEKQKKVRVRVPENTFVQVNGFTFQIKGGEPMMVPEQIADMLMESGVI